MNRATIAIPVAGDGRRMMYPLFRWSTLNHAAPGTRGPPSVEN
jgi:hypothetical protein